MAIKNYTTTKHPLESIGEIQAALAKGGAKKVMIDYDEKGEPKGLAFAIETDRGFMGFQLPANVDGVCEVFKRQKIKADMEQAKKTAWRMCRNGLVAKMELMKAETRPCKEAF